jgi:hypothetical protein
MSGQFELKEDSGRKYWFGAEDGWKDATEIGDKEGTLVIGVDHFPVGTKLIFQDPTDGE